MQQWQSFFIFLRNYSFILLLTRVESLYSYSISSSIVYLQVTPLCCYSSVSPTVGSLFFSFLSVFLTFLSCYWVLTAILTAPYLNSHVSLRLCVFFFSTSRTKLSRIHISCSERGNFSGIGYSICFPSRFLTS